MKIRMDFVTNSSSSSFICDYCGNEVCGYDMSYSEAGMCECENGHTICNDHLLEINWHKKLKSELKESLQNYSQWQDDDYYVKKCNEIKEMLEEMNEYSEEECKEIYLNEYDSVVPHECCPICSFKKLTDSDMAKYLLTKYKLTDKDVVKEVKNNFSDYNDFNKYINGGK